MKKSQTHFLMPEWEADQWQKHQRPEGPRFRDRKVKQGHEG